MKSADTQLLDNALDALDRLYDKELKVTDLWALLFATSQAMRHTVHYSELVAPLDGLLAIVSSGDNEEAQNERALFVSDPLRKYLAGL